MIPYICETECSGVKFKTMWVIKHSNPSLGNFCYLYSMYAESTGFQQLAYHNAANAFRFPDEQTAQAVLKFLNRENLEVVCIE